MQFRVRSVANVNKGGFVIELDVVFSFNDDVDIELEDVKNETVDKAIKFVGDNMVVDSDDDDDDDIIFELVILEINDDDNVIEELVIGCGVVSW